MEKFKICSKCKEKKLLSEFNTFKKKRIHVEDKIYIRGYCKKCEAIKNQEWSKIYRERNKEYLRERKSNYYYANKEKINKNCREYRKRNREYLNAYNKKRYYKNPERKRQCCSKIWYINNREKKLEYAKKYREQNTEKIKERNKIYGKKSRKDLSISYISDILGIPVIDLKQYPELIEAKQIQLKIMRE